MSLFDSLCCIQIWNSDTLNLKFRCWLTQRPTAGQDAENERLQNTHLETGCLHHTFRPKTQGPLGKKGQKDSKSQRRWCFSASKLFSGHNWAGVCTYVHSGCDSMHKTHAGSSQMKSQHRREVRHGAPPLAERSVTTIAARRGRVSLLLGCDPWEVSHAPMKGHMFKYVDSTN